MPKRPAMRRPTSSRRPSPPKSGGGRPAAAPTGAAGVAAEGRGGGTVLVASGARDTFQLASQATKILYPGRAGEVARMGPAEVRTRYGVDPGQVPDFIAVRGDPSDKLPGVAGMG